MKRDLMTPVEAAALLSVHTKTLSTWHKQGRLRAVTTPGGHRRYLVVDIERIRRNALKEG